MRTPDNPRSSGRSRKTSATRTQSARIWPTSCASAIPTPGSGTTICFRWSPNWCTTDSPDTRTSRPWARNTPEPFRSTRGTLRCPTNACSLRRSCWNSVASFCSGRCCTSWNEMWSEVKIYCPQRRRICWSCAEVSGRWFRTSRPCTGVCSTFMGINISCPSGWWVLTTCGFDTGWTLTIRWTDIGRWASSHYCSWRWCLPRICGRVCGLRRRPTRWAHRREVFRVGKRRDAVVAIRTERNAFCAWRIGRALAPRSVGICSAGRAFWSGWTRKRSVRCVGNRCASRRWCSWRILARKLWGSGRRGASKKRIEQRSGLWLWWIVKTLVFLNGALLKSGIIIYWIIKGRQEINRAN